MEDEEEKKQCVFGDDADNDEDDSDDAAEADWLSSFNTSSHNSFKV